MLNIVVSFFYIISEVVEIEVIVKGVIWLDAIVCKSIITKSKLPKVDYCCNIYVGCTHACKYCYAEFMKRFTGHSNEEWGSFLDYKVNCIDVLRKEIGKIKKEKWVLLGSVTDTYQPAEKKLKLTREALKIFLEYKTSISILTKSDLVVRDIDLFIQFPKCEVGVSCSSLNKEITDIIEPRASSSEHRLNALKQLRSAGVQTYLFVSPIIPKLTVLEDIFVQFASSADFVMGEALNLQGVGLVKFKKVLMELVGETQAYEILSLCKNKSYWEDIESRYANLCIKYGVENRGFFKHSF